MTSPKWRECPEYGGELYTVGGVEFRKCRLPVADNIGQGVKRCATCPIPAKGELIKKLVEALHATDALLHEPTRLRRIETRAKVDAALAAYGEGGARCGER